MGEKSNNEKTTFLSDSPITSVKEDLLGWNRLTDNIVKTIKFNIHEKGFAIGIKGKWGAGKSTILNFVEEKLDGETDFVVFRYNPWLYPNENHVENFFSELAKRIEYERPDEKDHKLVRMLRKYGAFFSIAEAPTEFILRILSIALVSLLAIGSYASSFLGWSWWLAGGVIILSVFLYSVINSKKFIKGLEQYYASRHELERLTLYQLKHQISEHLRNQARMKVIVLVDDIDRLPPKEICNVFQVVKNNGDIENLTYVLAFDDDVVKEVLKNEYSDQYQFFTEKIVQIAFTVPSPEETIIGQYFQDHLVQLFKELPKSFEENWEEERWANYNYLYFRCFFSNFRDVKRIVNGIRLNIELVFHEAIIEVNPVDFIAIEIIRIRFPGVYYFIRNNSEIFVYRPHPTKIFGEEDNEKKDALRRYSKCIENVDEHYRSTLDGLLHDLFPRIGSLTSKFSSEEGTGQESVRDSRICAYTVFDRYFLYGNYTGDIPNYEVSRILANISRISAKEVVDMLKKYHFTSQLPLLLEVLLIKAKEAMGKSVFPANLVRFAFEIGDYLPKDQNTADEIPIRFVITNFVEEVLENHDASQRANILEGALCDTSGIFGPLTVLAMIEPNEKEKRGDFIDPNRLRSLQKSAWKKGIDWLKQDGCLRHRHLTLILFLLKRWDTDHKFDVELHLLTKEDENFKLFLWHFLIRSQTVKYGEIAGPVEYKYDFDSLARLVSVQEIFQRVIRTSIFDEEPDEVKIAFETFKKDYQKWQEEHSKQQK